LTHCVKHFDEFGGSVDFDIGVRSKKIRRKMMTEENINITATENGSPDFDVENVVPDHYGRSAMTA
jgi:hypothetical protein